MDVFVARQPIFDENLNIYAYELLYRDGLQNYYNNFDGYKATADVITNSFMLIGLEALTDGKRAFVNFTDKLIVQEIPTLFPKDAIVVEILEDVEPNDDIVNACKKLKSMGYALALDDFVFKDIYKPLIDLADIIKVDFINTNYSERAALIKRFQGKNIKFLAEKVETREEFKEAAEMGYTYFQGYFFSKPIIVTGYDFSSIKWNYIQILNEINRREPDFNIIASLIERDVSLTYKLFRLINAQALYLTKKIKSIKQALLILGLDELKKWISCVAIRELSGDGSEIVAKTSLIRAKLGELLAQRTTMKDRSSEVFLTGLFSMIDILMKRELKDVLKTLPVSDDIKDCLLGKDIQLRDLFNLVLSCEKGDWNNVYYYSSKLKINESHISLLYLKSVEWSEEIYKITDK